MIRFMPDNWVDVLMRPLDMISPEGNVYVEVQAPDVRLAAALVLAVAVLAWSRGSRAERRPALQLLAITLLAMVPWLATTGNGRYFTPFLLLLGPLCIGLIRLLPVSTFLKFSTAGLLLLVQGVLVWDASPVGGWSLAKWDKPYFQLAAPPAQPRSYATLTPISYSLIAPLFPAESRWMNLSAPLNTPRERAYARQWLSAAQSLYLVAPSFPSKSAFDGDQPSAGMIRAFNQLISARGLSVAAGARCEFLRSEGLADLQHETSHDAEVLAAYGFWLCPLRYDPSAATIDVPRRAPADRATDAVFEAVEKLCPRFFPAGEASTQPMDGGVTRHYPNSDTRLYVLDDGEVLYKFWRSLNAVTIGSREDVLAGRAHLDCARIRAPNWRSGGP